MKIVSLNLRGFFDWEERLPRIVQYLHEQRPDVVLLQEVVFLPDISPYTQLDLLNAAAGFPHRYASISRLQSSVQFGLYREGLGVLSRFPVTGSETLILRHEEDDPHNRLVQLFEVADAETATAWKFANVHLSVRDDFALHHLEEVLGILSSRAEMRIIGGDFNLNHLNRHANLWRDDYVLSTEVKQYVSFAASGETEDYFLVPRQYELDSVSVSDDSLSDHRALAVDIRPAAVAVIETAKPASGARVD